MNESGQTKKQMQDEQRYKLQREEVLNYWQVTPETGLSPEEAQKRQGIYGPNALEEEEKRSFWMKILDQFKDFMIIILIIAAAVSGVLGELADAILIIAIVIVNAILGVVQEGRAEKAIEALQKMSAPSARVLRGGQQMQVPAAELVPGDIVLLEAGDIVPADMRLLSASNLKVEEASLTGESVPVEKDADFLPSEDLTVGDRKNLVYSSTSVTYGNGRAVVTAIASETEVGRIADRLKGIEAEETPLQVNLNQLGKLLGMVCLAVCAIVFFVGLLQGGEVLDLFLTAVSLAVAAIPEGLPAVVTIVLALGMNRMAAEHAIVKRLMAVETLGSIDTICSDKTGTLTQNAMTVTKLYVNDQIFEVTGSGYEPKGELLLNGEQYAPEQSESLQRLLVVMSLCNDAVLQETEEGWDILGDPTEGALLTLADKLGVDREGLMEHKAKIADLPFDSTRKMMTVVHDGFPADEQGSTQISLTKGAPDILLDHCRYEITDQGVSELTPERREKILAANSAFATTALRCLAYAYKPYDGTSLQSCEEDMIFIGLSGMIDPARPEVKDAIVVCHKAGIRVVMITGDYKDTAVAIARDLNLMQEGDGVLTGQELEKMSDEELVKVCEHIAVYARVSPEHKVRIVAALKANNHATSMTGDGVNDAPALKQADIGVAMGITGTEVAKGSASMILTDDNFATIVSAVREGRIIYSNIRKFVGFLLSCNVGEILVIFLTTLLLGPDFAPLLPIQLLWLNLVTDSFPALALGQEKGERDIMDLPPRKKEAKIIDREMVLAIIIQSLGIFIAVFSAFQLGRYFYPDFLNGTAVNAFHFFALPGALPSAGARTYAFVTLIVAELMRAFSCRSEHDSVFTIGVLSNKTMNKSIFVSLFLLLIVVYVPALDVFFHTISPSARDWGVMLLLAFIPFTAGELFKLIYHRVLKK